METSSFQREADFHRGGNSNAVPPVETEVDGRAWAIRHLSIALETDEVDEKDFHVALAHRLLAPDE